MANIKVLKPFTDVHTRQHRYVGEVFEATEERISEINSVDPTLIQVIGEPEVVDETPKKKKKKVKNDE